MKWRWLTLLWMVSPLLAVNHYDGSGAFVDTLARAPNNNDFTFGGTVSPFFWPTNQSFTSVDAMITFGAPPTPGTWTYTIQYSSASATQNCADLTYTEVTLCTIPNNNKSCTAINVPVNIIAPACVRGHAVLAGANNPGTTGGVASFYLYDTGSDGPMHFQGTGGTNSATLIYGGNVTNGVLDDRTFWLNPGAPIKSISGHIAMVTAPGGSGTWNIAIATTAPLDNTHNCATMALSTGPTLATITGSNKLGAWSYVPVSISSGSCFRLVASCSGTCTSSGGNYYAVDATQDTSGAMDGGGMVFESAGSGGFDSAHQFGVGVWGISDKNATGGATLVQQYWVSPPGGLNACAEALTFSSAITGTGQFDMSFAIGNTPLTTGQTCFDISYSTTSVQCSIASGQFSCTSPMTAMSIPGNTCFAMNAATSGGTPSAGSASFNWNAVCTLPPTPFTFQGPMAVRGGFGTR